MISHTAGLADDVVPKTASNIETKKFLYIVANIRRAVKKKFKS